jgi:DDE superfamily endonuclease
MRPYELLNKRPPAFKNLTGVGAGEFDKLYQNLILFWRDGERERLSRPNRQRAIGGGHPYTLELEDQLLMTLLWLHLHLNTTALGLMFGVDKATVSRNTRRVWQILPQLNLPLDWPEPSKRGYGKNLEQACRDYPDLLALVEVIDKVNPSPSTPNPQHSHSSGKQLKRWLIYGLPGGQQQLL